MSRIITDIVSEGLRTIFQQEWNRRHQATLGAWDNTPISGQELFNFEKRRPRAKQHLAKFKNGNTNEWDCTVLFDAILYSNSISKVLPNPSIQKEVENLRIMRNSILHVPVGQLPDAAFENASKKVRKSFKVLGLSATRIDKIMAELYSIFFLFTVFLILFLFHSAQVAKLKTYNVMSKDPQLVTVFKVLPPRPIHEITNRTADVTAIINELRKLYSNNNGLVTYF